MTESGYGKYICTDLKEGVVMPGFKGPQTIGQGYLDGYRRPLEHVIWMDGEVIPDAFYAECTWQWPPSMKGQRPEIQTNIHRELRPEMGLFRSIQSICQR